MTDLTLAFFGSYDVTIKAAAVTGFESDKVRALLAYLAVEARPHRREVLAGLLWPDMPEGSARHNLSQVLFNLRQVIGDRHAQPPFLLISRDTIQFNPASSHTLDVALFSDLLDHCATHPHAVITRCEECVQRLQQAAKLYRGAFLHQFFLNDSAPFEEWALLQREQHHRRALNALAQLAAYHEAKGDWAAALRVCEEQLHLDPWREEVHLQMMRVLALSGQRSAALAQFETCRRTLAAELGVEPAAETRTLYERIRNGDFPGTTATAPNAPPPGSHAAQADHDPAPAAPPLYNLPTRLSSFIGRVHELSELAQLLGDPSCRLLTLVGPGGMGKTRLAVQLAQELHTGFAHGTAFVPLVAVQTGAHIVPAIADALGFRFDGPADPQRQLLHHLESKTMLVILDNFEHLLSDAESITVVQAILQHAPALKLLVTAREQLNIEGEWTFEVGGLGENAAELFVQSARRVRAGFVLNDEDAAWVEPICRLVGYMPLGVELAASWVRVLPIHEIAGEITRNVDFLSTSARDVPARHRSMRAVFDYSWRLLSDEERLGLQRLAIFRNGFSRQAAEEVAGISLSLLSALVAKSLLHRTAGGRYDLHELVRQYAAAQLGQDPEDEAQTRARHSAYYASWLQDHDQTIRRAVKPEAAAAIRTEIDNILLAWQWASQQRQFTHIRRMIFTVVLFYDITNRFREGIEMFHEAAVALGSEAELPPDFPADAQATLGFVLAWEGWFSMRYGRLLHARACYAKGVALLRPLDAPEALSDALRGQGLLYYLTSDYNNARASLEESLAIKERIGDDWETGYQVVHRGTLAYLQGDYLKACQLLRQSLGIMRRLGYSYSIARALTRLSTSVLATGVDDPQAYDEAETLAQESLRLSEANEDNSATGHACQLLGWIALHRGNIADAPAWFRRGFALYDSIGDHWSKARVLNGLGEALRQLGDPAAAATFCQAAMVAAEIDVLYQVLEALAGLAAIAYEQEDYERALRLAYPVEQHPDTSPQTRSRASQLISSLATHLSREQCAAVREQSASQPLAQLVTQILAQVVTETSQTTIVTRV